VLAPNCKIRSHVVPKKVIEIKEGCEHETESQKPENHRIEWAKLLKRIFNIDADKCPSCDGRLRAISAITEPKAIRDILRHLKIKEEPPDPLPSKIRLDQPEFQF